jgi:outer membrane protein
MKRVALFAVFMLTLVGTSIGQDRYGHLNFGNLVASMPETKQANSNLETYQKQLVKAGEDMVKKFEADVKKLQADAGTGKFPPADLQKREADLQKKQQEILAYEQEVGQKVAAKRNELLQPIIQKAQDAISVVAKANGFKLIFDSSVFNSILFAQESDDVMALVAKELGVAVPAANK